MTTHMHTLWRLTNGRHLPDAPFLEKIGPRTETLSPLRTRAASLMLEKCLAEKPLLKLAGDHRGERVTCLNGVAWITQSGNPDDIFVCAGESFSITRKGLLLIEGLVETRVKITASAQKTGKGPRR
jgi:hypothetical protein